MERKEINKAVFKGKVVDCVNVYARSEDLEEAEVYTLLQEITRLYEPS